MVEPRHICVSLPRRLRKARFVLGTVDHVDSRQKLVSWSGPEGASGQVGYDRLILTAGSVNRLLPIPGVAAYAHGFRSIAEAIYLRDHITRQLELAEVATDPHQRAARCTFVVIGAGYTGTEVTAQGQLLTARLAGRMPGLAGQPIRWMLLDTAPRLLPDLDPRLSKTADRVLRRRGVEVRTGHARAAGCDQAADARRRRGSRSQASSKLADQANGLSPLVAGDPSLGAGAAHPAPRRGPIGLVPAPLAGNPGGKVRRRLRVELGLWRHLRECPRLPRSSGRSR